VFVADTSGLDSRTSALPDLCDSCDMPQVAALLAAAGPTRAGASPWPNNEPPVHSTLGRGVARAGPAFDLCAALHQIVWLAERAAIVSHHVLGN
jgi:hypothetical protein